MKVIRPKEVKNKLYYLIGFIIVILNYIKRGIFGYRKPRTFSINEIEQAVEYEVKVVDKWLRYLNTYLSSEGNPLNGKTVLELGPGPDIGIGFILLMMGIRRYIAFDVYPLAGSTSVKFYEELFRRIKRIRPDDDTSFLQEELSKFYKKESERIVYIVDEKFDLSRIKDKIDIIFSQAAFEHFSNVEETIKKLSGIMKNGGVLISEIDLRTHTSIIRDRDPLNIYRYSDFLWNLFRPKSFLNRIMACEYKQLFEKYGWSNIEVIPLEILDEEYVKKIKPHLYKRFSRMDISELRMLSIMLCASKV